MSDLTFDFLACLFCLGLVTFVLLVGAVTRTSAVVGVSIGLLVLGCLVFGLWFAYRLDGAAGPLLFERTALQTLVGLATVLLVVQFLVLNRVMRRRRQRNEPVTADAAAGTEGATPPSETAGYDRRWLLSLLQSRRSAIDVKIANRRPEKVTPSPQENPSDSTTRDVH